MRARIKEYLPSSLHPEGMKSHKFHIDEKGDEVYGKISSIWLENGKWHYWVEILNNGPINYNKGVCNTKDQAISKMHDYINQV
ncbi:hypothetical protein [Adhaeribacter pallidiroseus]|uniref:AP2/ERF domain-containing protein n=1 Tax=Adhaeribacter pallidiroseus TaxID=2072847 RepID=A0A369QLU8_9BACT|nr:hypothetical protein [Adhaeribacter pallidiroseus]RDC65913.1 hypothetical protein AHMF7616_04544 [Adhaeribacter pallidiroseus]